MAAQKSGGTWSVIIRCNEDNPLPNLATHVYCTTAYLHTPMIATHKRRLVLRLSLISHACPQIRYSPENIVLE